MESKQSCIARMLDVRLFVTAARRAMAGADPGAALLMVLVFGLIALCLLPVWVAFDLESTWQFTTALRDSAQPVIAEAASGADGMLGMSVGTLLAGLVLTSFTLLPTLFELGFPTVSHPLLSIGLWASIVFDYVTDWGKSWATTAAWAGESGLQHAIYCVLFNVFVSIGVQALLVVCLTVVVFGLASIVRGGARGGRAVILDS